MDGLYEVRYGTGDSAPVETDDFWSKINAFLDSPNAATVSAGTRAGLVALNLDAAACTATPTEWDHTKYFTGGTLKCPKKLVKHVPPVIENLDSRCYPK